MYTANRGYAMDTCIMCIYTICTVYTRLCTYTQYIYIYAYIHYSIIIYGLPFFFNASPLRGPYFTWGIYRLHPAALPAMPSQAKHLLPSGPNFVPKVFSTADLAPRGEEQDLIRKNKRFFHLQQSQDFHRQI